MKTTKKLLLALVALLIVSSVTMAVVFANELPVGSLSEAGVLMGKIESATTAADKVAAIEAFDAYMAGHTFPDDAISQLNYTIIVENASAAKLKFTEENIKTLKSSDGYQAMLDSSKLDAAVAHLSTVEGMFNTLYFDKSSDAYKTFAVEYKNALAPAYAEYNARIAANYTAPFGEYELPVAKLLDFEPNENGTFETLGMKAVGQMFYEYRNDGLGSQGSSGYYYEKTSNRVDDPFATMSGLSAGIYDGFVFEFDYYHVAGATLALSRGTCSINGTNSSHTEWGTFKTNSYTPGSSSYTGSNTSSGVSGNILVENAWNRIAFVLIKETGTFKVYANYKYLTSFHWTDKGAPVEFTPGDMRFKYSCGADAYGMRLDNMIIYYGTNPRILDRFEKMSIEERFIMSAEVIADPTQVFEDRESAYMWMQDNLSEFYTGDYVFGISEEAKAAVDTFLATNYAGMKILDHLDTIQNSTDHEFRLTRYDDLSTYLDNQGYISTELTDAGLVRKPNVEAIGSENTEVIAAVEAFLQINRLGIENEYLVENLEGLKQVYASLTAINDKSLTTIASREQKIVEIEGYIKTVGDENILPGAEYDAIVLAIAAAKEKLVFDNAVQSLKNALTSFSNAPTYDSQVKWANRVEALVVLESGVSIFADLSLLEELPTIKADYDSMSTKMGETILENNAKTIILCTDFYREYVAKVLNEKLAASTPEGDTYIPYTKDSVTTALVLALVQEEYAAFLAGQITEAPHWTYVRKYCVISERAVQSGYKEQYSGLTMSLSFHKDIYAYYYELIQDEHLAVIESMLVKYDTDAKTYVDKLGVFNYIENYIEKNGVNLERATTATEAIKAKLAVIEAELSRDENGEPSEAEKEYLEALKANTLLFIEAVDGMVAAQDQGYAALYAAWQNALQYYYFMEINSEEVEEAIAKYAVFEKQLIEWQTNSDLFIELINTLNTEAASTKAGLYEILAKACTLKPHTNETYEGMAEALALYNAKYNEYMGYATAINAEVEQTVTVVMAEREIYTVLGVIAKFFATIFG